MLISLNWLKDYIDIEGVTPEQIADRLTMASAEVESSEYVGKHFESVVAARIEKIERHPNAEKLNLATIFDGKETITVVCGAPNIEEGQVIPYAPLGTELPGGFVIKPAKIRGVESCGMLCSEVELGIGGDHSGILQLDRSIVPGTSMKELFGESDYVIEIENKTINHRPDLWGHFGIARELRAILGVEWKKALSYKGIAPDTVEEDFSVNIETDKGLHYLGLKMSGIKVEESPEWMKQRLTNVGLRPINNIVDITNYVMLETGHPMHAFDRRLIEGNNMSVKMADDGEKFITLDGEERKLAAEDIVISDGSKSLSLGGIMGGEDSGVKDDTTELFLEAALFDPATVRRSANRLDLRTDASSRFEKALWKENAYLAIERFVELVKELVPTAKVTSNLAVCDNSEGYGFNGTIGISPDRIRSILGLDNENLSDGKIKDILESLDFGIEEGEIWTISVPPHRRSKDISLPADIVEEVGRIYGYNNITPVAPGFPMEPQPLNLPMKKERALRNLLVEKFNANEVMSYSFCGEKEREIFPIDDESVVKLVDTKEEPYLRYTSAAGLLGFVQKNQKCYKKFDLFEIGKVFDSEGEQKRLTIACAGYENPFMHLKEMVYSIMAELSVPSFRIARVNDKTPLFGAKLLHPGRGAELTLMKWKSGIFGEIHPKVAKAYGVKGRVGYVEIDMDRLLSVPQKNPKFAQISSQPDTFFDITLVVELRKEAEEMLSVIRKAVDKKLLVDYAITDRYIGDAIPEGTQAISFRIVLNGGDRTLTSDEMKGVQEKVIGDLRKRGFKLKGEAI